jgi:hypothetical protein
MIKFLKSKVDFLLNLNAIMIKFKKKLTKIIIIKPMHSF